VEEQIIKNKIACAINFLRERDNFLAERDLSEWSISHRLAVYLECLFPEYNVDCEYNKRVDIPSNVSDPKKINLENVRAIRPDIIIHRRGFQNHNLLVIQIKKKKNKRGVDKDKESLKELTKEDGPYRFSYGLFVVIDKDGRTTETWFAKGNFL